MIENNKAGVWGGSLGAIREKRICQKCVLGVRGDREGRTQTKSHKGSLSLIPRGSACELCWEGSQPRQGDDAVG